MNNQHPIAPAPVAQMGSQVQDMNPDEVMREQLMNLTQQHNSQIAPPQHPPQHTAHGYADVPNAHAHAHAHAQHQSSQSPHDHEHHEHLDPNIGGQMMSESGGDDGDGRKGGKRELSQSKRAAQNRAAQRAFRQRKEGYIKKLEEQVTQMHALEENYKGVQAENYSLREYIIHLQSRLLESQGEFPQPPANVNLNHPHPHPQQPRPHEQSHDAQMGMGPMQATAVRELAAAGLKHPQQDEQSPYAEYKRLKEAEDRDREREREREPTDEDLVRSQLQAGVSADGLPSSSNLVSL